jgi:hypothetical protein
MASDFSEEFRRRLSSQAEVCARKSLEWLQKDLQSTQKLTPQDVFHLATAAEILLVISDKYGKK